MADVILIDGVEFRQVPGWDRYAVSRCGRVASRSLGPWRERPPVVNRRDGRRQIMLCTAGVRSTRKVARLVLEAWVGPCPAGMECCHRDGDRLHDALDNLRWDTRRNNAMDRARHGTQSRGEAHGVAKLVDDEVRSIRDLLAVGYRQGRVARWFGITQSTVCRINSRKIWSHVA